MKVGILDCETTIFGKGNPFAERNKLCLVGLRLQEPTDSGEMQWVNKVFKIEYDETPYADALEALRRYLDTLDTLVVFNGKFDLNWLARYGLLLPSYCRIWDCQLAEFILDYQRSPYPSLDGCLLKYGLGSKSHIVSNEYWAQGIDTPQIPLEILTEYLERDLEKTHDLYERLVTLCEMQKSLITLHMQDLRVLQEMEFNGLLFDWSRMETAAKAVTDELDAINQKILEFVPEGFRNHFNIQSGEHLSALLYGALLRFPLAEPYTHTYKTGDKRGTSEIRNRWREIEQTFEPLVTAPEDSGLKKDGVYSTDEETLRSIKHKSNSTKVLVESLLRRAYLEKLNGTYYSGIRKKCQELDWQDGFVHGTLNQCRVITGRLSSEQPNRQNFPDELSEFIVSRFP